MKRKFIQTLFSVLLMLCLLLPQSVYAQESQASGAVENADYLKAVIEMIKEKHKGEVTDRQLIEGALQGMFDAMDPYTTYFSPEEADAFFGSVNGNYEGIGISIEKVGEYVVVVQVFPSSPAERAGILPGDRIVEIDGINMVGKALEDIRSAIIGETGTSVTVGVLRNTQETVLHLEAVRGTIDYNPVSYDIRGDIGYIRIETFNANTASNFIKALMHMDQKKITKIVLDLRDNPGGLVDQAVAVARSLVPEGLITKLDFQSEQDTDVEYYSYLKQTKYKLAVLVNEMTASASEILAGAIQDTGSGILIGVTTYGKAKVQQTIPLLTPEAFRKYSDQLGVTIVNAYDLIYGYGVIPLEHEIIGWAKITTGEYTTPKGRMIDQKGILPDIRIANPSQEALMSISGIRKLTAVKNLYMNVEALDVYNAEKILALLGYDVDAPDMVFDLKTFKALKQFRMDRGITGSSALDIATQEALNRVLEQKVMELDPQYAKAVEMLTESVDKPQKAKVVKQPKK